MTAQPAVSKEMVQIITRILYALTAVVTLITGVLWIMNFQAIIEHGSLVKRVVVPVLTLSNGLVLVIRRRQLITGVKQPGESIRCSCCLIA